jgi:methionyl-tRNA formyltransferase
MPLRLIFMGTPDFSVPTLLELVSHGHEIVAVYTRAPKPGGRRGLQLQPTPVEEAARKLGVPVLTPKTLKTEEALEEFRSFGADAAVVVAYGLILPEGVLAATKHGCFNLHGSLLPRWRGAAPIERAILAGDSVTGVMAMKMDRGLDTGDIGLAAHIQITDHMTAEDVKQKLARIGAKLMAQTMDDLEHHRSRRMRQDVVGESYAKKIDKLETRIDWNKPARQVLRHIHGLSPAAWCEMLIGSQMMRVRILRCELADGVGEPGELLDEKMTVACGQGAIRLIELQKAGGSPMTAQIFLAGARLRPHMRLH